MLEQAKIKNLRTFRKTEKYALNSYLSHVNKTSKELNEKFILERLKLFDEKVENKPQHEIVFSETQPYADEVTFEDIPTNIISSPTGKSSKNLIENHIIAKSFIRGQRKFSSEHKQDYGNQQQFLRNGLKIKNLSTKPKQKIKNDSNQREETSKEKMQNFNLTIRKRNKIIITNSIKSKLGLIKNEEPYCPIKLSKGLKHIGSHKNLNLLRNKEKDFISGSNNTKKSLNNLIAPLRISSLSPEKKVTTDSEKYLTNPYLQTSNYNLENNGKLEGNWEKILKTEPNAETHSKLPENKFEVLTKLKRKAIKEEQEKSFNLELIHNYPLSNDYKKTSIKNDKEIQENPIHQINQNAISITQNLKYPMTLSKMIALHLNMLNNYQNTPNMKSDLGLPKITSKGTPATQKNKNGSNANIVYITFEQNK